MSRAIMVQGIYMIEDDEFEGGTTGPLTEEAFTNLLSTEVGQLLDLTLGVADEQP